MKYFWQSYKKSSENCILHKMVSFRVSITFIPITIFPNEFSIPDTVSRGKYNENIQKITTEDASTHFSCSFT